MELLKIASDCGFLLLTRKFRFWKANGRLGALRDDFLVLDVVSFGSN